MEIIGYKDKHEYTNKNGVTSVVYLMDCIELLKQVPDKYFELAIVDPPYGYGDKNTEILNFRKGKQNKEWNVAPNIDYFNMLFNTTKNQIIWGGNYFSYLWQFGGRCFIYWHKGNPVENFADGELAWTSFEKNAKQFNYPYYGGIQGHTKADIKFHPTQKPVALYEWLIKNYTKENDKILDTHLGSGSSRIAADKANLPFVGCELDTDYFYASVKRFKEYSAQQTMF